jgi:hypothetical protein
MNLFRSLRGPAGDLPAADAVDHRGGQLVQRRPSAEGGGR